MFENFDKQVNTEQLAKDVEEATKRDYPIIPEGTYIVTPEKLELGQTKDGRPMLKAQFKIKEDSDGNTTYKKQMLFYNRVLYGTKNDANMIASAVGFLKNLEPSENVGPIVFESYSQFADLVLDIMEDIDGAVEYEVEYDPEAFNSISISAVYDI